MKSLRFFCCAAALLLTTRCPAATVVMTPAIPYRSILDSPYYSQNLSPSEEDQPSNAYYEDFEELFDGLGGILVLGPGGALVPTRVDGGGGANYSVDGDDGTVDGLARRGNGWRSAGTAFPFMAFDFRARLVTNDYPVWFGFAITYTNAPFPDYPTLLQIIGVDDVLLASIDLRPLQQYVFDLPTGPLYNGVLNDVFVSWQSSAPIKRITITNGAGPTIDHFQWGYSIPEPGSAALLLAGAAFALRRRRFRSAL